MKKRGKKRASLMEKIDAFANCSPSFHLSHKIYDTKFVKLLIRTSCRRAYTWWMNRKLILFMLHTPPDLVLPRNEIWERSKTLFTFPTPAPLPDHWRNIILWPVVLCCFHFFLFGPSFAASRLHSISLPSLICFISSTILFLRKLLGLMHSDFSLPAQKEFYMATVVTAVPWP